ncbi:MAG: hypothetical protein ACOYO1_09090 [Bacteroidales bacterium]
MKNICILLFTLSSLFAKCAVDPAPPHVKFEIDRNILQTGAYITLIDDNKDIEYDRTQLISPDMDVYYFMFPVNTFKIKIKFKDSTEKISSIIYNQSRYSIYAVHLNSDKNITVTDITVHVKNTFILNFLFYAFLFFIIIKILPTWIILFPKDILGFLKYYGLAQLIYSLFFPLLIFFFHSKGLLISVIGLVIVIFIDNKILKTLYLNTKKDGRITISIILSAIFTILFCFYLLIAFMIFI